MKYGFKSTKKKLKPHKKNRGKTSVFHLDMIQIPSSQLKLFQELQVVLEEQPQVVDAIFQHGDALHTHAEGEARVLLRVDAAGNEDVGVAHAATQNLNPTRVLADVAAFAATNVARDVHLRRGLGEGEIRRTETHLGALAEELLYEVIQGLLQVSKRHVLVDIQALYLMEDAVGASRDGLVAEHTARGDDADRRLVGLHHADLHT